MPYNQKSDVWSLGCILYEMVTLRHAFDSNSMKGLVLKILRGTYPEIPSHYSQDLKDLISEMLIKDPQKRPSIRKVVEKEFLCSRISQLLTNTIAKHEFSDTFLKKHLLPSSENKENDEDDTKKSSKKLSQKGYPDDDTSMDKKLEEFKLDTSIAKEKSPVLKESQKNQRFKVYFNAKKSQIKTKTKDNEESKSNEDDDSKLGTKIVCLKFEFVDLKLIFLQTMTMGLKSLLRSERCRSSFKTCLASPHPTRKATESRR